MACKANRERALSFKRNRRVDWLPPNTGINNASTRSDFVSNVSVVISRLREINLHIFICKCLCMWMCVCIIAWRLMLGISAKCKVISDWTKSEALGKRCWV